MHHSASTYTRPPDSTTDRLPPADLCPYTKDYPPMPADLVFLNGTVITIDDDQPTAEAVAVVGNRIARVGRSDEIRDEVGPATRVIDLEGRTLLPGFNDNHTHPISYGLGLSLIDARPGTVPSLTALQEAFRAAATTSTTVSDGWLLARGYDDSRLDA